MPDRPPPNWFRKLQGDRLEVMLRADGLKLRASGREADVFELVEWFEDKTGKHVGGNWKRPPRTGPRQIPGQTELDDPGEAMTISELSSDATLPSEL